MSTAALLPHLVPARRVLELGADDKLRAAHQLRGGHDEWLRADSLAALQALPAAHFDLVLISDTVDSDDPLALFDQLARVAGAQATLLLQVSNAGRFALVEQLALGEQGYVREARPGGSGEAGLSPSALTKLLMDAGWMPQAVASLPLQPQHHAAAAALCAAAQAQGMPPGTARRTLAVGGFVVQATRAFEPVAAAGDERACFTVVVPTTRAVQFDHNIVPSPGLWEVQAPILTCSGAASPAEVMQRALPECDRDWVLLAHQDVYFPRGFGLRLNALLRSIAPAQRDTTLIGLAGVGVDAQSQGYRPAGFVTDRLSRFDHAASDAAVSIDEFAVIVSRQSLHRIDPRLGWHLWATDLCLTAICEHKVLPRIVRLPAFHNSWNDYELPAAFYASAAVLLDKHRSFGPVHTLCGVIDEQFVARRAA